MASPFTLYVRRFPVVSTRTTAHAPFRRKRIQNLRSFSSSASRQEDFRTLNLEPIKAAPEIDLTNPVFNHEKNLLDRIRIVPKSPSYFSAKSKFTDTYLRIEELWLQYHSLPKVETPPTLKWISLEQMKLRAPLELVKTTRFATMTDRLKHLSAIEPFLMPQEVKNVIKEFSIVQMEIKKQYKEAELDEWGRSLGIGKRKTSVARAYLVMGEGEVLINNRNLTEAFPRLHDRESALWPLKSTNRVDKYNVFGICTGGGVTGQAEAMTLAVANALLIHEPELEDRLRNGKFCRPDISVIIY